MGDEGRTVEGHVNNGSVGRLVCERILTRDAYRCQQFGMLCSKIYKTGLTMRCIRRAKKDLCVRRVQA